MEKEKQKKHEEELQKLKDDQEKKMFVYNTFCNNNVHYFNFNRKIEMEVKRKKDVEEQRKFEEADRKQTVGI